MQSEFDYRRLGVTEAGVVEEGRCLGCWGDLPSKVNCREYIPKSLLFKAMPTTIVGSIFGLCPNCYAELLQRSDLIVSTELRKEPSRAGWDVTGRDGIQEQLDRFEAEARPAGECSVTAGRCGNPCQFQEQCDEMVARRSKR
jgi:hypothetical protein